MDWHNGLLGIDNIEELHRGARMEDAQGIRMEVAVVGGGIGSNRAE